MRVAVVGAGLAGSATAWRLAQRGAEVTLLERASPANPQGSSHGSARIFRYAYADPFYARLVAQAREHWAELEDATGETFFRCTGSLDFGATRRPEQLAAVLTGIGVEHELLSAASVSSRWPGIHTGGPALWHPDAGVVDAAAAVLAMTDLARKAGATVHENWTVTAVEGSTVRSGDGRSVIADHVVLAAGGWLPELFPGLPQLRIRQEQAYHFPYREQGPDWPSFIHKGTGIQTYGLPGGRDAEHRGHKVAEYFGGHEIPTAAFNDGVIDPANRRRIIAYVERHLPGLIPEPYAEATCVFTMTPTEDFVIDTRGPLTVASPCSGHGAKFAPLLGAIIADSAMGLAEPAERFRLG
ncbi:sarcosine oxidase [Actinoplanes tereljensis]|uniref:N-methyltryptophan oxidase n=1 Tax=Paractinoplanes tereljensis TaxID=571912 RepID=A0A919NID7_9ACTN|nr:FAD-dependent oxidoreductase [Actinoplanes tereljensis]GIF19224.1 N-methyltryptophan oxidase [Actinoplanes tereljensis]